MSDGSLSQDELDALLNESEDDMPGSAMGDAFGAMPVSGGGSALSSGEIAAFTDLLSTSSSNEGSAVGGMIGKDVTIANPKIEVISGADIVKQLPPQVVEIVMDYESGCVGAHSYILDTDLAKTIAGLTMGQDDVELNDMTLGAVSEAMNVLSGNANNTIGTKIKKDLRTSPPVFTIKDNSALTLSSADSYVKVMYDFNIEGYPTYKLIEIYGMNVAKDMASAVAPPPAASAPAGMMGTMPNAGQPQMNMGGMPNMNMGMPQMNMGMPQMNMGMPQMNMGMTQMPPSQFQSVQFSQFGNGQPEAQGGNINLLMDVDMELTVELGRTKRSIRDILSMGEGTVIELDKLAGEPVDILVNSKLVARGEVVVIDESFGVRVTEIINPMDRLRDL
ncbi:MAG: flagellar motor switch phosphatase FliY [Spirochaetales bacterium]|nr:flagellar motor switch phosphatase FliY [Spirochaetales bacterium]